MGLVTGSNRCGLLVGKKRKRFSTLLLLKPEGRAPATIRTETAKTKTNPFIVIRLAFAFSASCFERVNAAEECGQVEWIVCRTQHMSKYALLYHPSTRLEAQEKYDLRLRPSDGISCSGDCL